MAALLTLSISVALQILAAFLALRLIRVSGGRLAWILLASAILLMALRRVMTLGRALMHYPEHQPVFQTELVALVISVLAVASLILIRPLFEAFRRSERELHEEKEKAQVTLQSIGDAVVSLDLEGRVNYMNPVAESLCGRSLDEARGRRYDESIVLIDEFSKAPIADILEHCLERGANFTLSERLLLIDQNNRREHAVEVLASPIRERDGGTAGTVLVIHDVTELKVMSRKLAYQATHDALTGLLNRYEFERRLQDLLDRARQDGGEHAMCYIDMDDFKIVNDTCGHIAGDEMLKAVAGLLRERIRESDVLARLGGDEFGILLESCPSEEVTTIVEHIRDATSNYSFAWQGDVFRSAMSIGIVPILMGSGTITDVLSAADSACYVAKERGRNRIHLFSEDDAAVSKRYGQMQWVQRIQRALEKNNFALFHQVIEPVDRSSKQPPLSEVLLRMYGDEGQLIEPGSFLPAAERYHMMRTIDRWVIDHVFAEVAAGKIVVGEEVVISINLSGQTLGDEGFLDYVLRKFEEHRVPYARICFEITETAVIGNIVFARFFIEVLRKRGCHFALDDFGSGLSSFSYLKTLPVDFLKIDGSFIRGLLRDPKDRNLVISINQIGHVMGINTIAEFVEDDGTLDALRSIGIDYAQGYAVGRPCQLTTSDDLANAAS